MSGAQMSLLDTTPAPREGERKPIVDFWLLAIQLANPGQLPDGWKLFSYAAVDDCDKNAVLIGAVAPLKTSGKNKGYPNWARRDRSTERTFVITFAKMAEAMAHHEATTGLCHACHGNGTTFASWNRDTGIKYRHCTRCNGTGNAPEVSHG